MNEVFRSSTKTNKTNIDKHCKQSCVTVVGKEYIHRHYFLTSIFVWETNVYLRLLGSNITPFVSPKSLTIMYHTKGLVSLRDYLDNYQKKINISAFFHELFSFVKHFKRFKFAHGNLHVDNIMIRPETTPQFFVIDLVNSHLLDTPTSTIRRTSFLGEYDHPAKIDNLNYFDIYTLVLSLKTIESIQNYQPMLKKMAQEYIPRTVLQLFRTIRPYHMDQLN